MTSTTTDDAPTTTTRLRSAADTCEELEEQLHLAKARRNELIAAGHDDDGMTYGQIAKATRLSRARIIAIIGGV